MAAVVIDADLQSVLLQCRENYYHCKQEAREWGITPGGRVSFFKETAGFATEERKAEMKKRSERAIHKYPHSFTHIHNGFTIHVVPIIESPQPVCEMVCGIPSVALDHKKYQTLSCVY